jgi:cytochrome c oxidase subunit II
MQIFSRFSLVFLLMPTQNAYAKWFFNMPQGVTPVSRSIYDLHMTIFWICVAIALVVFSVMIYALIYHRKARGVKADEFHEHPVLEVMWAVIPVLILVLMAIPATKVLMNMDNNAEPALTIKVTGYQWKWRYEYIGHGIDFYSLLSTPYEQIQNPKKRKNQWYLYEVDKPLVLPVHKKIRFIVTSNDVIHSWWVPELGIKRDAVPGFIYRTWTWIDEPGTYRGQCAELCGINHAYMPIVVKAVSESDFAQWLAQQKKKVTGSNA